MRATVFLTAAMLASISAVTALPFTTGQQPNARSVDAPELEARHHSMTAHRITYYSGKQMRNPACGGPNPTSHSMIAAVKQGGAFSCGDHVHIKHKHKSVVVKVVDYCASCDNHDLDLSTGAFAKLAPIDQGEISGATLTMM